MSYVPDQSRGLLLLPQQPRRMATFDGVTWTLFFSCIFVSRAATTKTLVWLPADKEVQVCDRSPENDIMSWTPFNPFRSTAKDVTCRFCMPGVYLEKTDQGWEDINQSILLGTSTRQTHISLLFFPENILILAHQDWERFRSTRCSHSNMAFSFHSSSSSS